MDRGIGSCQNRRMLKLYTEGRIKMLERRDTWVDFNDKAKGKVIQYNYYIQSSGEEGESEIFQVRSKLDFSKLVDVEAVFTLGYWTMEKRAGLTLLDAKAAKTA